MYNGFFSVFVGFGAIVLSIFRKNRKDETASLLRKYNKQILVISGIVLIIFGTLDLINSL